jgi:hypothetical protein
MDFVQQFEMELRIGSFLGLLCGHVRLGAISGASAEPHSALRTMG